MARFDYRYAAPPELKTVEKMFIDGEILRERAVDILGEDRVREIEYAQDALKTDILQGLRLCVRVDFWDNPFDDEDWNDA